jgi:glycosyltransferase involved in cell wall biosynthesis
MMLKFLLFSFCFFFTLHTASQDPPRKTICLNMIVKNESKAIKRCLSSVKNVIDYWIIVDTGSSDGTPALIKDCMKHIPGELHERPWIDFEHNRNQALALSKGKGDYLLFIDADEELAFSETFKMPPLDKDYYIAKVREVTNRIDYTRTLLVNNHLNWSWKGVRHELIQCPAAKSHQILAGVTNLSRTEEGCRSQDPNKYLNDAIAIEKALQDEPTNSRYMFYLGQSYLNAKEHDKALKSYEKRAAMGGYDEEVFISLYLVAYLQEQLKMPAETITQSYWKAFHYRPTRAEPLYRLAAHYNQSKTPLLGYLVAKYGLTIPYPQDTLFVEPWIYDWGLQTQVGECAAHLGKMEEASEAFQKILSDQNLPADIRAIEEKNLSTIKKEMALGVVKQ